MIAAKSTRKGTALIGLAAVLLMATAARSAERAPLERGRTIPMPGVEGRIDHMAVDGDGHRLFVAALGNNTLEVLDLQLGRRLHTITGLREPQGVAYLPKSQRIVVANGGDGSCRFFESTHYQPAGRIDLKDGADNLRYDQRDQRIYVGFGQGALAGIEPAKLTRVSEIVLPGHPESFQLESRGSRIFVNVPGSRQIAVLDRRQDAVVARWPMEEFQGNFPMALDETHQRLLIGCRKPARLVVLDAQSGKVVASLPCAGDTDDVYYDARLLRVYVSGGEGTVSVIQQSDADHYSLLATVPAAAGARTSLFVPASGRLYVAVPHRGQQLAEIWEYRSPVTEPTAAELAPAAIRN